MIFQAKIKNYLTMFIMFIYIITFLLPSKLVWAAETPIITLNGESTVYVATGSVYEDEGVTITDDIDNNLSATVTVTTGSAVKTVTTASAVTYDAGAYMVFYKEGTYKINYSVTDSKGNKAVATRTVEVNTMDDVAIDDDYNIDIYKTNLKFKLLSGDEIEGLLAGAITTPAAVKISRKDDTLTAEIVKSDGKKFTTSAAVTYEWYINNELVKEGTKDTYKIKEEDKGNSIIVKLKEYDLESEPFYISKEQLDVTTPAGVSVKINGTKKVGELLIGELVFEGGNEVTTGSAVTYEWYRLSKKDSEENEVIGDGRTYRLVDSDKNKYIKLLITYKGETYKAITSMIEGISGKSSSHKKSKSSSSSSSNTINTTSTTTNNEVTTDEQTKTINNNSNVPVEGWNQINGSWYLKDSNGTALTGWQQVNGTWYLLNSTGAMATGWQQVNGAWYLLNNSGAMATGWQQVNGTWYLLNSTGAMATGWQQVNGTWYLLNSTGAMATGWQQVDGTWYFLNSNGSLAE